MGGGGWSGGRGGVYFSLRGAYHVNTPTSPPQPRCGLLTTSLDISSAINSNISPKWKRQRSPSGWLIWLKCECRLCHRSLSGNGAMCLMMECQIAWYCVFTEAPRDPEDNKCLSGRQTSLWEASLISKYNQAAVGKKREKKCMIVHAWAWYIHVDTHAHTCSYIYIYICFFSLYLYWLFILYEMHRFPVLTRISLLSPGSVLQISICARIVGFRLERTWTTGHTRPRSNMCTITRRCGRRGRRGLNTVESH